jgi:hypothetical protein
MRSLSSITKRQWLVIIGLELAAIVVYLIAMPWVILVMDSAVLTTSNSPTEESLAEVLPTLTPTRIVSPTKRPTLTPTTQPTPTATSTPLATAMPITVTTPTSQPTPAKLSPADFAELETNPRAALSSKTDFFTSVCFGRDADPLQNRDYMTPADWSASSGRKCIFGYNINLSDRLPRAQYTVGGGPDGVPRFYLIPPEAFAKDPQSIKTLSQVQIIVDLDGGCDTLGAIGVTADGLNYQAPACEFLKPGGVAPGGDGSRHLFLPTNANNIIDPATSGGVYGFLAFPLVIFRRGFSLYFTGRAGYAPPRTWFESVVNTLAPNVDVETTAEMTDQQVRDVAYQFDRLLMGVKPMKQLASSEREAQVTSSSPVFVRSREEGAISFTATPGTVLSSIVWSILPQNNQEKKQFMETNLCLDMNGEEHCFTGVEDFAHCAFFKPCITGYSRLDPVGHGGYIATRYFPAGSAPILRDGKVTARFQAPDIGTVLEMEIKIRVRAVDPTLAGRK